MIRWGVGVVESCDNEGATRLEAHDDSIAVKDKRTAPQQALILQEQPSQERVHALHWAGESGMRPLRPGDRVLLNRTSLELKLGTGGFAIVAAIFEPDVVLEDTSSEDSTGHMMKLRYTPYQHAVLAVEEAESPHHAWFAEAGFRQSPSLEAMPVLIGELHSMLPIALCWLRGSAPDHAALRVAYIMTDGGALPLSFSEHVRTLQGIGWLTGTVTYGHAYGGDLETINKFTALLAARHLLQADLAIVTMGPGIAGTGTALGHTAMELGEIVNAVARLGGRPIIMPRISFADSRARHRGISHHTMMSLRWAAWAKASVPIPSQLDPSELDTIQGQIKQLQLNDQHNLQWINGISEDEISLRLAAYPKSIRTMGRSHTEDPLFFKAVSASAELALRCLKDECEDL
jgi:hypothetical protein